MSQDLATLQRWFFKLITAPEAVGKTLPEVAKADPAVAPLTSWIVAESEEAATKRLDVYANMYFFRLLDCVKDDFPKVVSLIGEEDFHDLITDYLVAHPPRNPSVRYAGDRLPRFLAEHPLRKRWGFIHDLAAIEWAHVEVFDAADEALLDPSQLGGVAPEDWPALRFHTIDALQLVDLAHPAQVAWLAIEKAETVPDELPPQPTPLVVWRRGYRVFHRVLEPDERAALGKIRSGAPFAEVCDVLAVEGAGVERAAERATVLLVKWIGEGILSSSLG